MNPDAPDTSLLARDPVTDEPLQPTSQPGYYPGYSTMSQKAFWDEATRNLLTMRVEQPPSVRYFTVDQARFWRAVFDHLIPQHDRTPDRRIPLVERLDERLYQNRSIGYRYENMPQDREAYTLGEHAIHEEAQARLPLPSRTCRITSRTWYSRQSTTENRRQPRRFGSRCRSRVSGSC